MRSSALLCTATSLFLGLGQLQAVANNIEPKSAPKPNSPAADSPAEASGTLTISGIVARQPVQAAPAQGPIQGPFQLQAGQGTITITSNAIAAPVVGGPLVAGIGAICGPGATMSIDANGTRQTQSEEYGQKVKITDDPQKGIKIEQTTHKGGSDETKSYEAKDADELQKKSPEGYKLYQKYLGGQAGPILNALPGFIPGAPGAGLPMPGQLQIIGGTAQLQLAPGQIPMPAPVPMPGGGGAQAGGIQVFQAPLTIAAPNNGLSIDAATQLMGVVSREIESAAKADAWKDASKEDKAAAKKRVEELKKALGELERKL